MTEAVPKVEQVTPAYVPYATFISSLDALRHHGIPRSGIIDKSIWDSQSGSVRGQLILAFKFLGLIDEQKRIQSSLSPLVAASSEDRTRLLRKIIEEKYSSILVLDLLTISQGQLDDAFRRFGITGSTLKCAVRFFVKACVELGIPISQRFSDKSRTLGVRRKRSSRRVEPAAPNMQQVHVPHSVNGGGSAWEQKLLDKFPSFDPAWSDELKAKWFEGFERLMDAHRN